MNKHLKTRFLFGLMSINIYSEDRYGDGTLYKHFLDIYLLGINIFSTFWKTGGIEEIHDGLFYVNHKYEGVISVKNFQRQ